MVFGADPQAPPQAPPPNAAELGAILGLNIPSGLALGEAGLPAEPQVLMGYERVRRQVRQPRLEANVSGLTTARVRTEQTMGLSAAMNLIYTDAAERQRIADRLVAAGLIPPDWTDAQLSAAWQNAVKIASDIYAAGHPMTPFDLLAMQGQAPGGGGEGLSPRTVVNKQIQLTTPEEARAITRQVLGAILGRGPSESEIDNYLAQVNQSQRNNPAVTTTRYSGSGNRITSTTTGGVNPQAFAEEWARREFGDEADDLQVATQYMPALFAAMQTPV